ncbi:MAG: FkbM family methyltransferase [Pseudomonadota bacterium]
MQRLLSELKYHRARRAQPGRAQALLAESLALVPSNANAASRWLKTMDPGTLAGDGATTRAALLNTLILGLKTLRDQGLAGHGGDLGFETFLAQHAPRSRAQLFQDLWALYESGAKRDGFFVEFGATNGVDISNSYLLETEFGWRGILAEPNPVWHDALQANRQVVIETKCVGARTGETLTLHLTDDPEFASTTETRGAARSVDVPTISLADLLDQHNAPDRVDFLSIDTEGSEFDILDAYGFGPDVRPIRLIAVEHNFEAVKRQRIHDLLTARGYTRRYEVYAQFDDWYALER